MTKFKFGFDHEMHDAFNRWQNGKAYDFYRDNVKGPGLFGDAEDRVSIDPQGAITMAPSYPAGALVLLHNLPRDVPPALLGATVKVGARVFRHRDRWEQQVLGSNSDLFLNVMRDLQNRGLAPCWPVSMMFSGTVSAPILPIWKVWND